MKKYGGEDFLNRLYKDLVHSDEVKHTAKGRNKNEDLAIYLERLNNITKKTIDNYRLELLKYFYYKRYIIKEEDVPESYFTHQEQLALERGYGHITYNEYTKKQEIDSIISEQKASLDSWLDYFISEDTNHYPMWFKYYVFQNVMKIGYFDKEKNEFTKRTNSTVKPFIEINREAISMLYDELSKYLDKQEISDEKLEQLIKNGSFNKIYSYITRKLDSAKKLISNSNEGIWKKYEQGSNPEVLFNDIHGKGTGWCTAGGINTASSHLEGGDFHVYYTKDENGDYTNPRIAIRMNSNKIAEIRGIAEHQNLESEMEIVVEEKLQEFPDKDEYKKKVSDIKLLTKIYNKHKNNEILTKEELRFLYEMDSKIINFGYGIDPRIEEIKTERNVKKDLSLILGVLESEISITKQEALEGNIRYHYNSLYLDDKNITYGLELPKEIRENLDLEHVKNFEGLIFPDKIGGYLDLSNLTDAKGIKLPKEVHGSVYLSRLKNGEGLVLPEIVGGLINLGNLESAEGLTFPKEVRGSIILNRLTNAKGLKLPEKMNGTLQLRNLISAKGLVFPKEFYDDIYLSKVINVHGLVLPEQLYGSLYLDSLMNLNGLKFPKRIDGCLDLSNLRSTKGLVLPESIGGYLDLRSITNPKDLHLPKEVKGDLVLNNLMTAKDLNLPDKIGGSLLLNNIISSKNLKLPDYLGGGLFLEHLKFAKDLVLPEELNGSLDLNNLPSAKGLVLPKKINGDLLLNNLKDVSGIIFPNEIKGNLEMSGLTTVENLDLSNTTTQKLDLSNLTDGENFILPKEVGGYLDLSSLKKAEGLVLPKLLFWDLDLKNLETAKGLRLPDFVGGRVNLDNLITAEGIILPKNEQGEFYVPGSVLYCEFTREELIEAAKRTEENQMKLNRTKS